MKPRDGEARIEGAGVGGSSPAGSPQSPSHVEPRRFAVTDIDPTTAPEDDAVGDIQDYEQHDLGKLFPLMDEGQFTALVADVRERGLKRPIVVHDGRILDGWHRYRACKEAGVPLRVEVTTDDPLAHVLGENLHRRHLTTSQKAIIAAGMVNSKHGRPAGKGAELHLFTVDHAASKFAVSVRVVKDARKVLNEAEAEVVECVRLGRAKVTDAVKVVADAPEHQTRAVALLAEGKAKSLTEGVRLSKAEHDAMPGVDGSGEVKRPASPPVEAPAAVRPPVDDATDEAKAPEQTKAPAADDSKQTGVAASTAPDAKPKTKREGGDDSTDDDHDDHRDVFLRPVKDGRKVVLEVVRCDDESEPQANMVPIYWQVHDAIRQVAGKDYKRLLPYV